MASTFIAPERWPFQAGEAVYYLPSNQSYTRPTMFIPAVVLSCHTLRPAGVQQGQNPAR